MSATVKSVDKKVREVKMNARKRPGGNAPRIHRRVHKQVKVEVFRKMQARYKRGMDARLAVLVDFPEKRWHESKKPRETGGDL